MKFCCYVSAFQVGTNGVLSFREPFTPFTPILFPSESANIFNSYVLAPFWSDVDNSVGTGRIFYEVHRRANSNTNSNFLLEQVSDFISNYTGDDFSGTWMLVAQWDHVHPYPAVLNIHLVRVNLDTMHVYIMHEYDH